MPFSLASVPEPVILAGMTVLFLPIALVGAAYFFVKEVL
jgi:hypothetical protein